MCVLCVFFQGLSKDKDKRDDNVQNSFWVYNIQNSKWSCIYRNENVGEKYWSKMQDYEPCPRFAHQLVYDHTRKVYCEFNNCVLLYCILLLQINVHLSIDSIHNSLVRFIFCSVAIPADPAFQICDSTTFGNWNYVGPQANRF